MKADSHLVEAVLPSPNHGERRGAPHPQMLILHYTGMATAEAAARRLCSPDSEVSCHYFVHEDGAITQMVAEARRAWHAGAGSWRGAGDINSRSIGIEIVNPGHEHGYRDFPAEQVGAVARLCADCAGRWGIAPELVLAHSDVAPARKRDPGEKFPWNQLFLAGVGHFCEAAPITGETALRAGDSGPAVLEFQRMLVAYGYGLETSGRFGETTAHATTAFQRHFRPQRVDGAADASTVATLRRLLDALERPRP